MDLMTAIKERRSCRDFLPDPVREDDLATIMEAGVWAPSPLNAQPWGFVVITNQDMKKEIRAEAERCKAWLLETSGWKWLGKYSLDFLDAVPVIIAITGDPKKTGADMFFEDGGTAYQHACAAAVQNMLLAAHARGLGTLWFTMYDKNNLGQILGSDPEKTPVALICLGRPGDGVQKAPRKDWKDRTVFVR